MYKIAAEFFSKYSSWILVNLLARKWTSNDTENHLLPFALVRLLKRNV